MFKKVLLIAIIAAGAIWYAGDSLTRVKDDALGNANSEASYVTRGDDGW